MEIFQKYYASENEIKNVCCRLKKLKEKLQIKKIDKYIYFF